MKTRNINIAKDFSETPLGRYPSDSAVSGERFREEFLRPALSTDDRVTVEIDGVEGYGSSFLDEAFGGLVRKGYFTHADLKTKLVISYKNADFKMFDDLIWQYIHEAKKVGGGR